MINEAITSDAETMAADLNRAVEILFQENVELYPIAITYTTAVTSPKLHGDYNAVKQYEASWHELCKEA